MVFTSWVGQTTRSCYLLVLRVQPFRSHVLSSCGARDEPSGSRSSHGWKTISCGIQWNHHQCVQPPLKRSRNCFYECCSRGPERSPSTADPQKPKTSSHYVDSSTVISHKSFQCIIALVAARTGRIAFVGLSKFSTMLFSFGPTNAINNNDGCNNPQRLETCCALWSITIPFCMRCVCASSKRNLCRLWICQSWTRKQKWQQRPACDSLRVANGKRLL